jgi:hypothetical protein
VLHGICMFDGWLASYHCICGTCNGYTTMNHVNQNQVVAVPPLITGTDCQRMDTVKVMLALR